MTTWPGALSLAGQAPSTALARLGDELQVEAEHGGHGAGLGVGGFLHGFASGHHQAGALLGGQGPGRDQGGVLAQAVTGDGEAGRPRQSAAGPGGLEDHQAEAEGGQLGVPGRFERLRVGVDQQAGQVSVGGVGQPLHHPPGGVVAPGDAHLRSLRALTGKEQGEHAARPYSRLGRPRHDAPPSSRLAPASSSWFGRPAQSAPDPRRRSSERRHPSPHGIFGHPTKSPGSVP